MEVMLLKAVKGLGKAGDVKKVADGYARNYLLPHGLAVVATDAARKQLADSLVNGKFLVIEGGDYLLCKGLEETCNCGGCQRHRRARGNHIIRHGKDEPS